MTTSADWWGFFNTLSRTGRGLLPPTHHRVLSALLTYADGPGTGGVPLGNSRPGVARLAEATGYSRSTVFDALAQLVEAGWISVQTPGGNQHRYGSATTYRLHLPAVVQQQDATTNQDPYYPKGPGSRTLRVRGVGRKGPGGRTPPTHGPTHEPAQPSFTSSAAARDDAGEKLAQGDGIPVHRSTAFRASADRSALLSAVQAVARAKDAGDTQVVDDRWCDFWEHIERVFGFTEHDLRGYTPPSRAYVDRLAAGTWLMKLLNTANRQLGSLEWTPTPEDPAAHAAREAERRRQLDALTARQGAVRAPQEPPQEADPPGGPPRPCERPAGQ